MRMGPDLKDDMRTLEHWDLLNVEQRVQGLETNTIKLTENRKENLRRLQEQKDNCYTEVRAFRDDLNKYLDELEQDFFGELSILECEHRKEIQDVVSELRYLSKTVKDLKTKLDEIKYKLSNDKSLQSLELIKTSILENETYLYSTMINKTGGKEVDLNMSLNPEVQTLTSRIKTLGEVYIALEPVDIDFDEKKPVLDDSEMDDVSEDKNSEKDDEGSMVMYLKQQQEEMNSILVPKREPIDEDYNQTEIKHHTIYSPQQGTSQSQALNGKPSLITVKQSPVIQLNCVTSMPSTLIRPPSQPSIPLQLVTMNNRPVLVPMLQKNQRLSLPKGITLQQMLPVSQPSSAPMVNLATSQPLIQNQTSLSTLKINNQLQGTLTLSTLTKPKSRVVPILIKPATSSSDQQKATESENSKKGSNQISEVNSKLLDFQRKQKEEQPTVDEVLSECKKNLYGESQTSSSHQPLSLHPGKRFSRVSEEEIIELQETNLQSKATIKNTKWGVKIFQEWSVETTGSKVDLQDISKDDLNEKLKYFYMEIKPKPIDKTDSLKPKKYQSIIYNKNTMKNVRSAINRHLQNLDRDFDIVRDFAFRESNALLDTKMKLLAKRGLLPEPQKRLQEYIDLEELKLINHYVYQQYFDPKSLRFRVWYFIAIHFTSLGVDFQNQLTLNSFDFLTDQDGKKYVMINHETINHLKGGHFEKERMYAKPDKDLCPLTALFVMIQKTKPKATALFNRLIKEAELTCTLSTLDTDLWYNHQPLFKRSYSRFMTDLCMHAGCFKSYSAYCLHETALQAKRDPDIRQIMYDS